MSETATPGTAPRKLQSRVLAGILVLLLAVCVWWGHRRGLSFNVHSFVQQMHGLAWWHIIVAILLIYVSYLTRGYRWAVFLKRQRRVGPLYLVGAQFIGFTAVALFGRIADLSRPFLIARKTRVSAPSQIAVYTIERMFDLGAAALIFSTALAFAPAATPHHEVFIRVGLVSLAGTLLLAGVALGVRFAGVRMAAVLGGAADRISPSLGAQVRDKLLAFRDGLESMGSARTAAVAGVVSVVQWLLIAWSYVHTVHAFSAEPTLAHLSFASTMLLMAASMGSSVLQLPVLGWFTQIAATAASMHAIYGTPLETATACGAMLLVVNLLCIIPIGLVFARIDGVSLTDLKDRSETAEEALL